MFSLMYMHFMFSLTYMHFMFSLTYMHIIFSPCLQEEGPGSRDDVSHLTSLPNIPRHGLNREWLCWQAEFGNTFGKVGKPCLISLSGGVGVIAVPTSLVVMRANGIMQGTLSASAGCYCFHRSLPRRPHFRNPARAPGFLLSLLCFLSTGMNTVG